MPEVPTDNIAMRALLMVGVQSRFMMDTVAPVGVFQV